MKCGREKKNGPGICPAATEREAHGANDGRNGGRICWAVTGTFRNGKAQGTYAEKFVLCIDCEFRTKVQDEEGCKFRHVYFKS